MDTSGKPKKLKKGLDKLNNNTGTNAVDKQLSKQQRREIFIKSYINTYSPTIAAIQSGKAISNAHNTLKNSVVQGKIKELEANFYLNEIESKRYIQYTLMQIVERCMTLEPSYDKEGMPTGMLEYDAGNAIKALTLLGQEVGMFQKTVKINLTDSRTEAAQYLDAVKNAIDVNHERKD